jgi:hypothetical protein
MQPPRSPFCAATAPRRRRWRNAQAGVCAFSLTSRITQRDGTTGARRTGQPHPPVPRRPGTAPAGSTATFTGVRPPAGTPACPMIPGWRPPPGPGSPGVRRHPAGSPAIPEPGPRARRHPGAPAGPPFTPCAVTLDQLHRQEDGPRAAGTTDGDASAPQQSRKTLSAAPIRATTVKRAYGSGPVTTRAVGLGLTVLLDPFPQVPGSSLRAARSQGGAPAAAILINKTA